MEMSRQQRRAAARKESAYWDKMQNELARTERQMAVLRKRNGRLEEIGREPVRRIPVTTYAVNGASTSDKA